MIESDFPFADGLAEIVVSMFVTSEVTEATVLESVAVVLSADVEGCETVGTVAGFVAIGSSVGPVVVGSSVGSAVVGSTVVGSSVGSAVVGYTVGGNYEGSDI